MLEQLLKYPVDIFRQGDFYFGIRLPGLILFLIFVALDCRGNLGVPNDAGADASGGPRLSDPPPRPRALWARILSAQAFCNGLPNKPGRLLPCGTLR